jgi:hypothetical protein
MKINYKYLALGILVGYLLPYIIALTQNKKDNFTFRHSYNDEENEEEEEEK